MNEIYLKKRFEWRRWLSENHAKSAGIWLVFYKKQTGLPTLTYDEAVEEALCFGWIDSLIKKRDDQSFLRKMTPRQASSLWSDANRSRIAKLERKGLMKLAGQKLVETAKSSGQWDKSPRSHASVGMPPELVAELAVNKKAMTFFQTLAPSYQKQFMEWIAAAKRLPTKQRRVKESIELLQRGEKLGMK